VKNSAGSPTVVAGGGNTAFLTGNTCWWQFRLEDGGDTFVCYRDAAEDAPG
jgi:hypothetical protein